MALSTQKVQDKTQNPKAKQRRQNSKTSTREEEAKSIDKKPEEAPVDALEDGITSSAHNQELGRRGEIAATSFLEKKGFYIHDRNWKCRAGEVDIVAEDADTLVFVEVKTRSNCDKGLPEEAVDAKKRKRYEKIAAYYLQNSDFVDKAVRFDVISILVVGEDRAFLRHHCNAFCACE